MLQCSVTGQNSVQIAYFPDHNLYKNNIKSIESIELLDEINNLFDLFII